MLRVNNLLLYLGLLLYPLNSQHSKTPFSNLSAKSGKLDDALRLIESWPSKFQATESDDEAYSVFLHARIFRPSASSPRKQRKSMPPPSP
ncbi:hypothetical protein FEM48_Zijuj05G0150100 [Ziziphus jujuba var. spinosa]|uniref:Uncharacterized protein n=1 Tax=Ziziphus jujuba var. spinosa TaxID=714518 RepID=A0A978VFH6_ZIZJJ|nr:hypothetical protein FEM48_Zijuj05G0150100 [Ziziphus jujuba var. spinosa]